MLGLQLVFFRLVAGALVIATAPAFAGLSFHAPDDIDHQTRTVALPAGRSISIDITVGSVRIEGSARPDAMIDIIRTVPAAAGLARIPVVIDETASEVRIRGLQSDGGTDPALRTDLTLRVPAAAVLSSVRIMEGRLAISGLRGAVNANVRRGSIDATDVQGIVRLETGIGDVVATRITLSSPGLLRLRTFNGNARLSLARQPADARILALALNGTITSQIPLQKKETWGPRWGEATLGKGEPVVSIDVVTGAIDIKVAG